MSIKEQVQGLLETLPDDVTYDDIHYHLFVREKIDKGLKDVEEGRILSEEEMEAKFKQWLEG
jgi:predicted transcriptional regulator